MRSIKSDSSEIAAHFGKRIEEINQILTTLKNLGQLQRIHSEKLERE